MVILRGLIASVPHRGPFGINWVEIGNSLARIRNIKSPCLDEHQPWLDVLTSSHDLLVNKLSGRFQADRLARLSSSKDVRLLLLFMIDGLVSSAAKIPEASAQINLIVNVPELILQTLASGFCNVDYLNPPKEFPDAEYDKYFDSLNDFVLPETSQPMTLRSLLVVVPAILAKYEIEGAFLLINPNATKPLQQKLIDTVRNPASHTIADFKQKDSQYVHKICEDWLSEWCRMEGLISTAELPIIKLAPSPGKLRSILLGDEFS